MVRLAGGQGRLPEDGTPRPRARGSRGLLSGDPEFPQPTAHPRLACPALGSCESRQGCLSWEPRREPRPFQASWVDTHCPASSPERPTGLKRTKTVFHQPLPKLVKSRKLLELRD